MKSSALVIWTHLDKTFSIDLDTRPDEGTGGRGSSHGLPLSTVSSFGLHLGKDSSLGLAFCKLLLLLSLRTLALLLLSSTSWLLPGEELPARPLATVGPSSEATALLSDSLLPDNIRPHKNVQRVNTLPGIRNISANNNMYEHEREIRMAL